MAQAGCNGAGRKEGGMMSFSMAPAQQGAPGLNPSALNPGGLNAGGLNPGSLDAAGFDAKSILAEVEALGARVGAVRAAIARVIFGQDEVVDQTLITLLSG